MYAMAATAALGAAGGAMQGGGAKGAVSGALGALTGGSGGIGGSGGPKSLSSDMNDRSPINVCPVGLNLGSIVQPFDQGGTSNGGSGLDMLSRYLAGSEGSRVATSLTTPVSMDNSWMIWVAVAGAGVVAVYLFTRKGR